jgi:hypothetical protein
MCSRYYYKGAQCISIDVHRRTCVFLRLDYATVNARYQTSRRHYELCLLLGHVGMYAGLKLCVCIYESNAHR